MYLSSGRGRKSGGARATGATPSLAPLVIIVIIVLIFHVVPYFLLDHSVNDLNLIFAKALRKCIRS